MKKLKKRNYFIPAAMLAAGILLSTAAVIPSSADPEDQNHYHAPHGIR